MKICSVGWNVWVAFDRKLCWNRFLSNAAQPHPVGLLKNTPRGFLKSWMGDRYPSSHPPCSHDWSYVIGWDMFTDINEFDTYQESHVINYVQFMVYLLFTFLFDVFRIWQHLACQTELNPPASDRRAYPASRVRRQITVTFDGGAAAITLTLSNGRGLSEPWTDSQSRAVIRLHS